VQTPDFKSSIFHYGIGVFQGCTASPVLYNVVMQMLLDLLHQEAHHLAYSFGDVDPAKSSVGRVLDPSFADDLTIVTRTVAGSQFLLDKLHSFLTWSRTMRLKVPKCLALAFGYQGSTVWGSFDPQLAVGGQVIPVMGPAGCKYLGRRLDPSLSEVGVKAFLCDSLLCWMRLVDGTPLLGSMRCWIYDAFIVPKLSWFFTIHNLSLSFVKESLHTLVLPFLKRWCVIPKGGNSAILFCGPPRALGLALKPVYTVYKACQVVRRSILQRSRDPTARLVFELELARAVCLVGPAFCCGP
jgi:Reverse transcriptase (RNA-dependent DNA polymerase)